jgi:hypothetical protein
MIAAEIAEFCPIFAHFAAEKRKNRPRQILYRNDHQFPPAAPMAGYPPNSCLTRWIGNLLRMNIRRKTGLSYSPTYSPNIFHNLFTIKELQSIFPQKNLAIFRLRDRVVFSSLTELAVETEVVPGVWKRTIRRFAPRKLQKIKSRTSR